MTLLTVVKDVCAVVGVQLPQSVFSAVNSNRTMQEMLALANEMAQRIAYDSRDWTAFRATVSYPGDGVATSFNLPADYKRMLLTANVWRSTSVLAPMRFVPDTDEWLNRRSRNIYDAWGEWTILANQIRIFPAMMGAIAANPGATPPTLAVPAVTAYFAYLHKNCIQRAGGGFGDSFQQDGDSFALDERVLKLGMIWQWKAQKGSPYAEDLGSYGDALMSIAGRDSPAPILIGRRPISQTVKSAYPFMLPVPSS